MKESSLEGQSDRRLEKMSELLDEIANDNAVLAGSIRRLLEAQESSRNDLLRELSLIREDFAGDLAYRVLKDLCTELVVPLSAMEAMLERADFSDPATIRGHLDSLVITLRSVLSRMGAQKIAVSPGEEIFDPNRHRCIGLLSPEKSPFPSAPPRTIVRVIEDGYTLAGRVLVPAKVEVQSERMVSEAV
jgi:molecular chaperone GrpE (heat shock protein)